MEYELEEKPRPHELVGYRYSDRFLGPQPRPIHVEPVRPDLLDRAIRIPEQELGS